MSTGARRRCFQQGSKLVGTGAVGSPSKASPSRDHGNVIQKAAYSQNATGENNQVAEQRLRYGAPRNGQAPIRLFCMETSGCRGRSAQSDAMHTLLWDAHFYLVYLAFAFFAIILLHVAAACSTRSFGVTACSRAWHPRPRTSADCSDPRRMKSARDP